MQAIADSYSQIHQACPDAHDAAISFQRGLESIGAAMDGELTAIFKTYCARRFEQKILRYNDAEFYRRLLVEDEGFRFGNKISEYLTLIRIVAGNDLSTAIENDLAVVESFRRSVNAGLLRSHPGSTVLNAERLSVKFEGKGIKIAVYDVFDLSVLAKQRNHYPSAQIHDVVMFGNPVSLDHGNSVIDGILAIAPSAEIIPISSDSAASVAAIQFLRNRKDVSIVNMSRPLMQGKNGGLDIEFRRAFEFLVHEKIVVKAIGNAGTDLAGNISPARRSLGLGSTGDLSAYDGALIQELLTGLLDAQLILAQNWTIDGASIALSATVAGENEFARARTVGAPADGMFSFATSNFESGSSFAAPQISAIIGLLLESQIARCGAIDISQLSLAVRSNERLLDADAALDYMMSSHC